jgi:hypothetical protein
LNLHRTSLVALAAGALALTLSACGAAPTLSQARVINAQSQLETQSVPPQSAFVTIKVKVTKILPKDNDGLPHQNFVVEEISPKAGLIMQCNNDTKYGSEVPNLAVGQELTIRGVTYGKASKPAGIHWTHKANKSGDAGYIKTADGHRYQ